MIINRWIKYINDNKQTTRWIKSINEWVNKWQINQIEFPIFSLSFLLYNLFPFFPVLSFVCLFTLLSFFVLFLHALCALSDVCRDIAWPQYILNISRLDYHMFVFVCALCVYALEVEWVYVWTCVGYAYMCTSASQQHINFGRNDKLRGNE